MLHSVVFIWLAASKVCFETSRLRVKRDKILGRVLELQTLESLSTSRGLQSGTLMSRIEAPWLNFCFKLPWGLVWSWLSNFSAMVFQTDDQRMSVRGRLRPNTNYASTLQVICLINQLTPFLYSSPLIKGSWSVDSFECSKSRECPKSRDSYIEKLGNCQEKSRAFFWKTVKIISWKLIWQLQSNCFTKCAGFL